MNEGISSIASVSFIEMSNGIIFGIKKNTQFKDHLFYASYIKFYTHVDAMILLKLCMVKKNQYGK